MLASPGNTQVRMFWQVVMRGGYTHQPAYPSRVGPMIHRNSMAHFTYLGQKFAQMKTSSPEKILWPGTNKTLQQKGTHLTQMSIGAYGV